MTDHSDLRARITEALYQHAISAGGRYPEPHPTPPADLEERLRENSAERAEAVMAVVGPELDRVADDKAALDRLRALHIRDGPPSKRFCLSCTTIAISYGNGERATPIPWPCPTMRTTMRPQAGGVGEDIDQ